MSMKTKRPSIESVYSSINRLSVEEQLRLVTKVLNSLDYEEFRERKLSIKGLKGLGKELWQGKDAQDYVNRERDEWET